MSPADTDRQGSKEYASLHIRSSSPVQRTGATETSACVVHSHFTTNLSNTENKYKYFKIFLNLLLKQPEVIYASDGSA